MQKIFSILGDVIEEIIDAYKYAEYDFYKLMTDVTLLLAKARKKGYNNPDICSLTIKVENRMLTTVVIDAYYKKNNGKYQKFCNKLDIGTLTNVPVNVGVRLKLDKELVVKLSDLDSFESIRQEDIVPNVKFDNIYHFKLKDVVEEPSKKELHISDNLFYYKVVLVYKYDNGKMETRIKYFGNIVDLPSEINDKLSSNDDRSCFLDVTNV